MDLILERYLEENDVTEGFVKGVIINIGKMIVENKEELSDINLSPDNIFVCYETKEVSLGEEKGNIFFTNQRDIVCELGKTLDYMLQNSNVESAEDLQKIANKAKKKAYRTVHLFLKAIDEDVSLVVIQQERKKRVKIICGCVVPLLLICALASGLFFGRDDADKVMENTPTEGALLETTGIPESILTSNSTTIPVPTLPVQETWSEWDSALPDYVSEEKYLVEEQTLYRYRLLETTTGNTAILSGWELYDVVETNGDYGPWSKWSTTFVEPSDTKQVESEERYRFRTRETMTSSSPILSGWSAYDITNTMGEYGEWSSWETTPIASDTTCDVEIKTQYSYRTKTVVQEYTDWGEWSEWQSNELYEDDLTDVEVRKVYGYYYYRCDNCGAHMHGHDSCYIWAGGCGAPIPSENAVSFFDVSPHEGLEDWHGTGKFCKYINGSRVFKWENYSKQEYRSRKRSLEDVMNYSEWSDYSDVLYEENSFREVRTRTVYRYRERQMITKYHFYKWSDWSEWSTVALSDNENREVVSETFYRYRDRDSDMIYYFRRWTDWSEYSEVPVEESDTCEIEVESYYRFKLK